MRYLLFILMFSYLSSSAAQDADSLKLMQMQDLNPVEDSVKQKNKLAVKLGNFTKKVFAKDFPNPRKALIFGLIVPGAGQAYNRSFWKVPIVLGAIGTTVYLIDDNRTNYFIFRDVYKERVNTEGENTDVFAAAYPQDSQLKTIRDQLRKDYELSWIALVGVGILSAAEAFVDCHLKSFDISEDLSFKPQLNFGNAPGMGQYAGIGVVWQW